jgi:hypothetical protein
MTQVGRACAVAGYADLYGELGLLPDVSIADEARETRDSVGAGSFGSDCVEPARYQRNITPPTPCITTPRRMGRSRFH